MNDGTSVYLDTCCFIEVVKAKSKKLSNNRINEVWYIEKLLQAHRDRAITLYTSAITIAEATHIGEQPVPGVVQDALDRLIVSGQYVYLVQPDPFICIEARNLYWKNDIKLKGADGIHLASAIDRRCSEFLRV